MVSVMERRGYRVAATDLYTYNQQDFLAADRLLGDWIITNPPFKASEEFIRHAVLDLQPKGGVAFLLKSQYWHASRRRTLFHTLKPTHVLPLTWRPDFLFGAKAGAPTMEVLWTVWQFPYSKQHEAVYYPLTKPKDVI